MSDVYYPKKSHHGYYDKGLGCWVNSKSHKKAIMEKHNIVENISSESDRHRTNRIVDEINYTREKQGLKPKTKAELIGDSREKRRYYG